MNLDDSQLIERLDKSHVYQSILALPQQCQHAWQETRRLPFPKSYHTVSHLVVAGMGGSALGAHVISSVYKKQLKLPLQIVNHYQLPHYVNRHSLVILSSYSGNTEETLAVAQEAKAKKARLVCLCTDGQLAQFAQAQHLPLYQIDPQFNPSNQPRLAIGYSIFGQLGIFARLNLIDLSDKKVTLLISQIEKWLKLYLLAVPRRENPAKQAAAQIKDKIIIFIAAEHLQGAAHVFNNQINENAKNFSALFFLPELNHHLLEGLAFPSNLAQVLSFLLINSSLYFPRVQTRSTVTADMLKNKHLPVQTFAPTGRDELSQAWETIVFGSFVSFYLAMLNQVDPAPIPTVDYFKKQLSLS